MENTEGAGRAPGAEKDKPTQLVPGRANLCSTTMVMTFGEAAGGHIIYVTKSRTFRFIFNYSVQNRAPAKEYI